MCLHCWRWWEVLTCNIASVIQSLFCWIWRFAVHCLVERTRGNSLRMQSKCVREAKTWARVFWVARTLVLQSILPVWQSQRGDATEGMLHFSGTFWMLNLLSLTDSFFYICCYLEICIDGCHGLGMVLPSLVSPTGAFQTTCCLLSPSSLFPFPWGGMVNWRLKS